MDTFLLAKVRFLPGVVGSFTVGIFDTIIPVTREYSNSGIEQVTVDNTAGDHVTPNSFSMNRTKVSGGLVNGRHQMGPFQYYDAGPVGYPSTLYQAASLSPPNIPVPGGMAAKLFAGAQPERYNVLLPTFVFELRELPVMVRELGRYLYNGGRFTPRFDLNGPAKAWLSGNFGWAPLVSDLTKMIGFAEAFSKREREMDRVFAKGGAKRRVQLYSATGDPIVIPFDGSLVVASWTSQIFTAVGLPKVNVWGTVRVKPGVLPDGSVLRRPPPHEVAAAILGLSKRHVAANVWEALPWSWLIDYFFNVGDYLDAHSGGRSYTLEGACIMTHNSVECTSPVWVSPPGTDLQRVILQAGTVLAESKDRQPVFSPPLPEFLGNPLSGHQLSILGSIGVLRGRPQSHQR